MVGRLLERYALTIEEVDVRREPCVQVDVPIGGQRRRPIDACVPFARSERHARYVFFGFETDTALAAYLFTVIDRAIKSELLGFRQTRKSLTGTVLRRASASFQHGMAARIAERLETMHADREATVGTQRSNGTALIVVRHQVVEDAFRASKIRLHALPGLTLRRNAAYHAGRIAGERVNLNRPLHGSDRALLT